MGPVLAALQAAANGINVALVKATPGYRDTDAAMLTMLWFTRPRLGWLIVCFVTVRAEDSMYWSCVATALAAEMLLQVLAAFAMGTTANFAQAQHFYNSPIAVFASPHGTDAMAMYAGALLWLVVVIFTLVGVGYLVLDMHNTISRLGGAVGLDAWVEKGFRHRLDAQLARANAAMGGVPDAGREREFRDRGGSACSPEGAKDIGSSLG